MCYGNKDDEDSVPHFKCRSSSYLTEFFNDCEMEHSIHNGSTPKWWAAGVFEQVIQEPINNPGLPSRGFQTVIKVLMDKADAKGHDPCIFWTIVTADSVLT